MKTDRMAGKVQVFVCLCHTLQLKILLGIAGGWLGGVRAFRSTVTSCTQVLRHDLPPPSTMVQAVLLRRLDWFVTSDKPSTCLAPPTTEEDSCCYPDYYRYYYVPFSLFLLVFLFPKGPCTEIGYTLALN